MNNGNNHYFYVAYVAGTDLFKIGTSVDPKARKNTAWNDAPEYVREIICSLLKQPRDKYVGLKHNYHYVIMEPCPDKAAAKSLERQFRKGIAFQKLCLRNGNAGDWFSLSPINILLEECDRNAMHAV